MRYHINTDTGRAGQCGAAEGNCPFGTESQHYTSAVAARAAYEASREADTFTMSLKDMNATAKATDDHDAIAKLIESGSERTLNNLAKNQNLTLAEIKGALERTTNPSTRASLLTNQFGPAELITPEDLEELVYRLSKERSETAPFYKGGSKNLASLINNDFLTDAHFNTVMNSDRFSEAVKKRFSIVLAESNSISPHLTYDTLKARNWQGYPITLDKAIVNGKLSEDDLINAPEVVRDRLAATGPPPNMTTKELDILGKVAVKTGHDRLQMWVAKDSRTSSAVLNTMGRLGIQPEAIYGNPNTSAHIVAKIVEERAQEPYVRMGELKKELGDAKFAEILKSGGGSQLGRSYSQSLTQFDMEKVRQYGLNKDDIFYLAGSSSYNAGASFNSKTGVFTGKIDSSD